MVFRATLRWPLHTSSLLLASLLGSGCSSWKTLQPISPNAYAEAGPTSQMRVELPDGRVVTLHSPRMDTDTLRGLCAKTPTEKTAIFGGETLRDSCALALRDIKSVKLKRVNVVGMALLIGVPVAAWLIILHSVGP